MTFSVQGCFQGVGREGLWSLRALRLTSGEGRGLRLGSIFSHPASAGFRIEGRVCCEDMLGFLWKVLPGVSQKFRGF